MLRVVAELNLWWPKQAGMQKDGGTYKYPTHDMISAFVHRKVSIASAYTLKVSHLPCTPSPRSPLLMGPDPSWNPHLFHTLEDLGKLGLTQAISTTSLQDPPGSFLSIFWEAGAIQQVWVGAECHHL